MKEKISVKIAGAELHLLTEEKEKIEELAAELDEEISSLIIGNQRCTKLEAAILCALSHLENERRLSGNEKKATGDK